LVSFLVSSVGAAVPLLPRVLPQAALYEPSVPAAVRIFVDLLAAVRFLTKMRSRSVGRTTDNPVR
jgi:hypothetical protein